MQKNHMIRYRGFSLIEVMVTSFILALGLMAVVAMQATAKRSSFESQQRTLAAMLAEDMVERVRLNILAWQDNNPGLITVGTGATARTRPTCAQDNGLMSNCNTADVVNQDLYHWEYSMLATGSGNSAALINPTGCMQLSANGDLTVVVTWLSRTELTAVNSTNAVVSGCGASSTARRRVMLTTRVAS